MSSGWPAAFQDLPERAEVLRHCRLDPGGDNRGKKPQPGLGGLEFHGVDKPCRAGRRYQLVADGCLEGPDLPVDRQPAGWLEDGYLKFLGSPAGDGTGLAVSGAHPDGPGGGLAGVVDGVVPYRDVLEVRQEHENLLGGPLDRHGVLECLHWFLLCQLPSRRAAAVGSWAGRMTRSGICFLSARTLPVVWASWRRLPTPGTWRRSS